MFEHFNSELKFTRNWKNAEPDALDFITFLKNKEAYSTGMF